MDSVSIYFDVIDKVKEEQNGSVSISSFNRKSRIAELKLLDYLSGDVEGLKPPEPYQNEKIRDWLTVLLTPVKRVVENGVLAKEENYYMFENASVIGSYRDEHCGEEVIITGCDTPIELLDGAVFDKRCGTHIESLKPSIKKPIAKLVGENFEFNPKDLGSINLTYKRVPVFGEVKVKVDPVYMNEIPDPATSINYEWPEYSRPLLVWFISQEYAVSNRETNLTQQLQAEGKSTRG